ncbi:MAG: hypothetical protein ACI9XO_003080 [Paraglaciecola sp.]|jgi:hypothetical protein
MPNFRTKINVSSSATSINHQHRLLSFGSCFTENIGQRLINFKFHNTINPFGILYNPISIINNLNRLLENDNFKENELFENNGLWHSFAHHSIFSKMEKVETLEGIQKHFQTAHLALKNCNRLILTFGTAHVFENIETGEIVANCHKMPAKLFQKRRLTVLEIIEKCKLFFEKIKLQNKDLEIIVTISPVRHIRDGLLENQKSKATLQLAVAELCEQFNFIHYFPAYEIMMDDLRDYRFYTADMIHPNQVAIDYIWEQFQSSFFNENTQILNRKLESINTAVQHRPFHPQSAAHQQFLKKQLENLVFLESKHSFLDLKSEYLVFQKQIF